MALDPIWERVFSSQAWGKYPGEDLIRFVARNFYGVEDRARVKILEVGSGTGANLWFMAREGFSVHGIDGSPAANKIARERIDAECPGWRDPPRNGSLRDGDILALPWPDASFNAVIDSEAVYCNDFDESRQIYREMHRVSRPGGRIFVRTFATGTWGDGTGEQLGPRRFIADVGPLAGKGKSRLTAGNEIEVLLAPWKIVQVEIVSRSVEHQQHTILEWIIEGIKI
jgi:SAM-dependent methyltransferase